jgi:hypothetical protein
MGQTRTSGYTKGGFRCLGGVSIPCRPVTTAVSPVSKSGNGKNRNQEWLNDWYETHQTVFGPKESCIGKLDRCNDRKIYKKLPVNEIRNPCDINLFVSRLPWIKNWSYVKQAHAYWIRYKLYMQLKMEYWYIGKESWRWRNWNHPVCHRVESLFCR